MLSKINTCISLKYLKFLLFFFTAHYTDFLQWNNGYMSPAIWGLFIWALCNIVHGHTWKSTTLPNLPNQLLIRASVQEEKQNLEPHWLFTMHMFRWHLAISSPVPSEPIGLCKKVQKAYYTSPQSYTSISSLSAYLYIHIRPLTCFSASTTQIAECDLVKCENEHKQGNVNSGCQSPGTALTEAKCDHSRLICTLSKSPRTAITATGSLNASNNTHNYSFSHPRASMSETFLQTPDHQLKFY